MASQLELDLDNGEPRFSWNRSMERLRERLAALALGLVVGSPVWIPLGLAVHLTLLGLLPARAEARRLDGATQAVEQREAALVEEARLLARERRMLEDDVYRERLRLQRRRGGELPGPRDRR